MKRGQTRGSWSRANKPAKSSYGGGGRMSVTVRHGRLAAMRASRCSFVSDGSRLGSLPRGVSGGAVCAVCFLGVSGTAPPATPATRAIPAPAAGGRCAVASGSAPAAARAGREAASAARVGCCCCGCVVTEVRSSLAPGAPELALALANEVASIVCEVTVDDTDSLALR